MKITRAGPIFSVFYIFLEKKIKITYISYMNFHYFCFSRLPCIFFLRINSDWYYILLSILLTWSEFTRVMFFAAHKTLRLVTGAYDEDAVDLILRIFRRRKNAHARYRWHTSHRLRCTCSVPPPLVAMQCNVMQWNAMLARSTREDSTEVTDIVTMPFSSSTLLLGVNYVAMQWCRIVARHRHKSQSSYANSLII